MVQLWTKTFSFCSLSCHTVEINKQQVLQHANNPARWGWNFFFFFSHFWQRGLIGNIFPIKDCVFHIYRKTTGQKSVMLLSVVMWWYHDVVKPTEDIYHHWSSQACHFTCCGATHWVADQTITEWPGLRQLFHTRIDYLSTQTTFWVVYNQKTVVLITHRSWQISKVAFLVKESVMKRIV